MKTGLVLEGGGLRGMFTAGVLDAFMEHEIAFDGIIGVSAGALFGCNYKSHQPGRALRYNVALKNEPRYMGLRSLFKTGDIVGSHFAYHVVPFEIDVFDGETYAQDPTEFWVVCTDIETGLPVYHRVDEFNHQTIEWLRASASMPAVSKPVELDGHMLLDGGIVDSIPLCAFQNMGFERNIVVLTQPADYYKKPMRINWLIRMLTKQYPKVGELMAQRHEMYNRQLDYLQKEAQKGNTLLINPKQGLRIGRTELNEGKMKRIHAMGYDQATLMINEVKDFLTHV